MSFTKYLLATCVAISTALPALADAILIHDAYMRTSGASAKTGAAFMHIMNDTGQDDRLISASSDIAKRVELHTHKEAGDGVMKMIHVQEGFAIPAGGMHPLARGGDHVMFMGLTRKIEHGDVITLTMRFEKAGEIIVEIPVDQERKPEKAMQHGDMHNGAGHMQEGMKTDSDG